MRFEVRFHDPGPRLGAATEEAILRVGEVLRRGRGRAGLSQRALAERAGVDQATISRLERGLSPYARLAVVARVLAELDLLPASAGSRDGRVGPDWIEALLADRDA